MFQSEFAEMIWSLVGFLEISLIVTTVFPVILFTAMHKRLNNLG